jgi:hypothetical protein
LTRWIAPEPPPGLAAGVWARVDAQRPTCWESAWAFRIAAGLTVVLWLAAALAPPKAPAARAAESLAVALARAGGAR